MPYSFTEFKKWLDHNPTRRPTNITDTVLNLWSSEHTWVKLLRNNPLVKEWLTEQGIKPRDWVLIHWNYCQRVIKNKKNIWKKQIENQEKNLVELNKLNKVKEFINPLFDPQNKPFILIKKSNIILDREQALKEYFGNYYQFGALATWKIENNKLVIKSIHRGQAEEHILEKMTADPYYLGKLALTENELITNQN